MNAASRTSCRLAKKLEKDNNQSPLTMEELLSLEGDDMDLRLLAQSFPTGPAPRVEKRDERYYLILESQGPREDAAVLSDGTSVLAQMVAIMLKDGSNFRPPRIRGITKKMEDGSLRTFINASVHIKARTAMFVNVRRIGPDGKEIVQNKGPTEQQIELELARNNEPFRRAYVIYGSLEPDWINLYKVLEAMEDGNGGERGLIAQNFVPGKDIKDFKATAESLPAIGMKARHAKLKGVVQEPRITLANAEEMFRKLFQGWIEDLKKHGKP